MHRTNAALAAILVLAACGGPAKQDPKAPALEPAVIATPKDTTVADTTKKPKVALIPENATNRGMLMAQGYSLATATMVNQDPRMLASVYDISATLTTPDTTYRGGNAVIRGLITLAKQKSLSDFQRTSRGTRIIDDSTLVDSGTYVMTFKRNPKDSTLEHGEYTTRWRARPSGTNWNILEDHLTPKGAAKKRGK